MWGGRMYRSGVACVGQIFVPNQSHQDQTSPLFERSPRNGCDSFLLCFGLSRFGDCRLMLVSPNLLDSLLPFVFYSHWTNYLFFQLFMRITTVASISSIVKGKNAEWGRSEKYIE
jgi:hypothetical protein